MQSDLVEQVSKVLRDRKMKLVTAESCTGGMIAAALTDLAGSSDVFDRGFVTYSNEAKQDHLGVSTKTLNEFGAVSSQTAKAMAQGALNASNADIAISVTGIAGPGGGSEEKPVGLVYMGLASGESTLSFKHQFEGDRASIRAQSVDTALTHILESLS